MKGHVQTANTTQAVTKHTRIETKLCPNLVPQQIGTVLKCQPTITAVVSLSTQYLDHANPARNEKELINVGICHKQGFNTKCNDKTADGPTQMEIHLWEDHVHLTWTNHINAS